MLAPTFLKAGLLLLSQLHLTWALVPRATGLIANCAQQTTATDGNTCDSFGGFGLSRDAFKALNPKINEKCTNLIAGELYCVKVSATSSSSIATSAKTTPTTATVMTTMTTMTTVTKTTATSSADNSVPTSLHLHPGYVENCKDHERVQSGDTCYKIATRKGTTPEMIMKLNSVGTQCEKLFLGYDVCSMEAASEASKWRPIKTMSKALEEPTILDSC
ncbi:uncharacterized protein Triagg1_836 [Trichoderma aggressivum f. europaeum]|uniref:LysM domain-containing protein n=1 Tax=Trichoderma aggressivum f. europaeum TaxID=173218 RepID=A0AAE1IKY3_9HYPO|nr:hypothetical protein Triagg1_836 [Trichoderma aggressivum f. europaeum]